MIKVTLFADQHCVMSGIAASIEFFNLCNYFWHRTRGHDSDPLFHTEIVTKTGAPVSAFGGIPIQPSRAISEVRATDLILIPSFQPDITPVLDDSKAVVAWLKDHHQRHAKIGAISAGAFILAETGLLNNRISTTNWLFLEQFKDRYPEVRLKPQQVLTEDGGLMCTASNNFTVDLCTYFIKQQGFKELAAKFSKGLMLDPNWEDPSPWTIFDVQKKHNDKEILKAQEWMEENYSEIKYIDMIAHKISFSPRHFKRRFKKTTGDPPLTYLQRLRVEAAKHRLEATEDTISDITWRVGYDDTNSFRRLFKKHTGFSPKEYRHKFSETNHINL
jgi:transcriptional regulator GlxA family with amidase domain